MSIVLTTMRDTCGVAAGNRDYTTPNLGGLIPKGAWLTALYATSDGVGADHAVLGLGAVSGASNRWACCVAAQHGVTPSNTVRRGVTDQCVLLLDPATGGVDGEADFVAFIPGGIRLNWGNPCSAPFLLLIDFFAGTGLSACAVSFNVGNQDVETNVNTIGWEPHALLTAMIDDVWDDASRGTSYLSHGVVLNTSPVEQYSWAQRSEDSLAAATPASYISDVYGLCRIDAVGALLAAVEFGGFDAQGFSAWPRLNNMNDDCGALALHFGGEALFAAGIIDSPTANGDHAWEEPKHHPQWVHLGGLTQMPAVNTAYSDANSGSIGVGSFDENNEYCASAQDEDAANPTDTQGLSDNQAINLPDDDGTQSWMATFSSFIAKGWILNFTASEGTAVKWWYFSVSRLLEAPPAPPPEPTPAEICTWADLVAAAQQPEAEPLARVTLRSNPFVADQAMDWSLLGDFTGSGPLDGVTTDNDVLIIVHEDGQYKIITDGQSTAQWDAAWTSFALPAGCTAWGTDVEIFAVATDGTDVQVFARRTSSAWSIFMNESNDDGATWNGWIAVGTSTYTNGAANYVIGGAVVDTVFLRHYESNGICLEAFNNEGATPWTRYELETNLELEVPPPSGGCDVVQYGEIVYVYIGALHRDPSIYGYRIYLTTFYGGDWGPVDYLVMADVPETVDSIESLFSFNIGTLYGLTYDARDIIGFIPRWEDNFEGYDSYWRKVADFEDDEAWVGANVADDGVIYVEATEGRRHTPFVGSTDDLAVSLDLSVEGRFTDDDYVCIAYYVAQNTCPPGIVFHIRLRTDAGNYYYKNLPVTVGWHFERVTKGNMDVMNAPNWANITSLYVLTDTLMTPFCFIVTVDDWRVAKADPNDASTYNETGVRWDFPDGEWHIYSEDDDLTRITLGQIDVETGVEKFAVRHAWPVNDNYEILVPIKAKRDDGLLGIAARMTDTTPGSEDGYILVADTTNNLLRLYRMDNGVKTQLDSASYTFNLDTWYYLGLRVIRSRIEGFASTAEAGLWLTALVEATDTTHATGQLGVISQDTVARFDKFAIGTNMGTEVRKGLHLATTPDIWPTPTIYEIANYSYPRDRIVHQGDHWYAFDESDADFVVVEALSPIEGGADTICPAETVTLSLPAVSASATSAQAVITLSNVYGKFDDDEAYVTGAEVRIEAGYQWYCGEAYAEIFTGIINHISEAVQTNTMEITAYDFVYKLKKWAANKLYIFKSQFKIWLDLTEEDDTKHLVDIIEGFTYDSDNERYRTNAAATENMVLHGEYFNDVAVESRAYFVDDFTSAWMGIILRSDVAGENCYGVLWNYAANTISIRKKTDGAWGAALSSVALNACHSASLWIRAEIIHDTIYVWTSIDGIIWTSRTSYADTSPLGEGHVGFAAYPAADLSVDLREFTIYAFDTEKTVEKLMTQIATMAGVTAFDFEDEINENFVGTDGDSPSSDNWRVGEETLTTADINSNRLRCIAPNASWGYLNSTATRKTFVLDFQTWIPNANEPVCIIFRTNTTFTEGYRLEIYPGAVGAARVRLIELDGGSTISDIYPNVAIDTQIILDFTLSVQDNFDETRTFVSLWYGARLIFSCHDDSWPTEGYVGIGAYDDDNAAYFYSFVIDMLDTPVISHGQANYFVINVGETADKLIAELAAVQNARWFFNGSGTFVAGMLEPGDGVADVLNPTRTIIVLQDELYVGTRDRDDDEWVSHVRVVANNGVYADAYDNTLLGTRGYRFHRLNISADLSAAQCLEIGEVYLEQQQKTGDTFSFRVTPAQFGLERRMRFHAHAPMRFRDPDSPLRIDRDFIVGSQRITMKREPAPDWDMSIGPEEV
jgi:hypothetical protein